LFFWWKGREGGWREKVGGNRMALNACVRSRSPRHRRTSRDSSKVRKGEVAFDAELPLSREKKSCAFRKMKNGCHRASRPTIHCILFMYPPEAEAGFKTAHRFDVRPRGDAHIRRVRVRTWRVITKVTARHVEHAGRSPGGRSSEERLFFWLKKSLSGLSKNRRMAGVSGRGRG